MRRLFCFGLLLGLMSVQAAQPEIQWQSWSPAIFQQVRVQHRFVLLDLRAGWCHWCHVMDETTYHDSNVVALVNKNYIAVRVDQDARPDIAQRYQNYGWPATVVFAANGGEIIKRRGYIEPQPMAALLQAIINDPSPGPSVQTEPVPISGSNAMLLPAQRDTLRQRLFDTYDARLGGWGHEDKFLDWNALLYCLETAEAGDARAEKMFRQTLKAGRKLLDPVWGGVYQYSTGGDWRHPHFEKIMPFQAENLRVFSLASARWHDSADLRAAQGIHSFLRNFLTSPDGAFYTSEDADRVDGQSASNYFALSDQNRRAQGLPRIDQHIYSSDNGLAITGLAALYAASGDEGCLNDAKKAAVWLLAHRSLRQGGFRHDEHDDAGPYLADTLAMGRAFTALYAVTADRIWLEHAEQAASFICANFQGDVGFISALSTFGSPLRPQPDVEENCALALFANLLGHYSGRAADRAMAEHALRFIDTDEVISLNRFNPAPLLLANLQSAEEPQHIIIVGQKSNAAAQELFLTAQTSPAVYRQIEWVDGQSGEMANGGISYPKMPQPAAFFCSGQTCSSPISNARALRQKLRP